MVLARNSPPKENESADAQLAPELMARVRQIQIRTRRLVSDVLSGAYRSTFRGSGVEFEEVRPYQPGDDVRSIDWNRTARSAGAFVKTYVEERELTLLFLVDTSRSMDFGSREFTKREIAAQFCALLSYVALRHHDQVGLSLFGERPGLHLPPRKGAGAVARVVREVIAAKPTGGGTDFGSVLDASLRTAPRRALVFLVSDFLSSELESWQQKLSLLAQGHDVIATRIVDPFELELPESGCIPLCDVESGRWVEVDTGSAKVREVWRAAAISRQSAFRESMRRARVGVIELSTTEDIADPVIGFFRRRRRGRS